MGAARSIADLDCVWPKTVSGTQKRVDTLSRITGALSGSDAARRIQQARTTLFDQLRPTE